MPRGGARPGSGPKKGTKYRKRLRLTAQAVDAPRKQTQAQRMAELRRQVALWTAGDMKPGEIAAVLGLDLEKLKTLFARELAHGRALTRASLLARLDGAGNVSADKRLLDEIAPAILEPPNDGVGGNQNQNSLLTADRPRGVGKKEWARMQASEPDAWANTPWESLFSDTPSKPQ